MYDNNKLLKILVKNSFLCYYKNHIKLKQKKRPKCLQP